MQSLALMLTRADGGPALVVAPTSVCGNWLAEAKKFAPSLNVRWLGDKNRHQLLANAKAHDLFVCSYGVMQNEVDSMREIPWHTIVADEAQTFKNPGTARSRAIMSLPGDFRMIATGTPIENHLGELWNLFRFINPGLLGSSQSFKERFATPIELHENDEVRQQLKAMIKPFILRRLKREVLTELPPRTEITHLIEFNDQEREFYESLRQNAMQRIGELSGLDSEQRFKVLAEITTLRQASCHPALVTEHPPCDSAKLREFSDTVTELRKNGHRCLVFSQFVGHLKLIRAHLDARRIKYQYLDGSTSAANRTAAVDAFQSGEGELFLISLKAGNSGLNLTAADYVIHMDPWWNPAVEDQASDRAYRMGQKKPVTIYRMIVKDTIEEKIVNLHQQKRDLANALLEGTDNGSRLSVEELVALIEES
jgi:SNF2 family DNA or RNA helicase